MQVQSRSSGGALTSRQQSKRVALRAPAPFGSANRARSVQVYAKGKGKGRFRQVASPPNIAQQMMQQQQVVPEIDPENEEFVLFARAAKGTDFRDWVSISIVKGGSAANVLVRVMESEWGRRLYGRTLINNIATSIYQDRDTLAKQLRKNVPPFANVAAKDFEFAFKIRDKRDPKDAAKATNLTILPPEEALVMQPIDKFKKFWTEDLLAAFTAPAPAAQS